MSYEGKMLEDLKMPARREVEQALLRSLFKHNGTIKEFGGDEQIVSEIADDFGLSAEQRAAFLETIYRKEGRVKKSYLWHRLLFRAADSLANENFISRPTQTFLLTNKKEWMLTEKGYSRALEILNIPLHQKENLPVKSYEVQKIIKSLVVKEMPKRYYPFERSTIKRVTQETKLRSRAFRLLIKEAYNYKCAVCGMKIHSPNGSSWEVEAAHIVPRGANGKDDIWNGLALCRLHHWAFDVGWFTLTDNFRILASDKIKSLPDDYGKFGNFDFMKQLNREDLLILLPKDRHMRPHLAAIRWHRENIFSL